MTNKLVKTYTMEVFISSKGGRWIMRIFAIELSALDVVLDFKIATFVEAAKLF